MCGKLVVDNSILDLKTVDFSAAKFAEANFIQIRMKIFVSFQVITQARSTHLYVCTSCIHIQYNSIFVAAK